jgi:phosphate acetyltransferase
MNMPKCCWSGAKWSAIACGGGALISSLLGNDLPGPGTIYQSQNFEFHIAVELGDTLTISITVKSKNAVDGSVTFDCLAVNQRDEKIITGEAKVKAPTKKPTDEGSPYAAMQLRHMTAFKQLIGRGKGWEPVPTAGCHPCGKEALEGAIDAAETGLVNPILVGPEEKSAPWPKVWDWIFVLIACSTHATVMNRRFKLWRCAVRVKPKRS